MFIKGHTAWNKNTKGVSKGPPKGVPRTKKIRKKISNSKKGHLTSENTRQKIREHRLQYPIKNFKFRDTSIELKMKSLLRSFEIEYLFQYSLEKIANVDFYIPSKKLVIQCDGCYWHGCSVHFPERSYLQEKDRIQDSKLTALGYKIIRFWEHEINNMQMLHI